MTYIAATALTDIEYNGENGRSFAKKGTVVSDLTEQEYRALEALKAVPTLPVEVVETPISNSPSQKTPTRFRSKKRGR